MQPMNCWSSLSETSCMTPRPNCAGLPVTVRSVVTSARVALSPSEVSRIVTVAPAAPLPRLSLPLASITARRDWSSRSTKEPDPAYSIAWPSLTLTVPENPSSVTSVTVAPGKQPPTSWRSMNVFQVSSTLAGTVKLCVSSMPHAPPRPGRLCGSAPPRGACGSRRCR